MLNNIKQRSFFLSDLNIILIWALILRIILFVIVINSNDPFIISDDRAYEGISKTYLLYADGLWDWNAIYATGADGYLQVFWPYTICFFAKLLQTEYAGRILNIVLSLLIIYIVYDLTSIITQKHKSGLFAAKLMAFLPYPLMFSVFNIKDFFIMFGVFYAFRLFVKWQNGLKVSITSILLCIFLLIGVYFARGGVVEFIGIAFAFFLCNGLYRNRQYIYLILTAVCLLVTFTYLSTSIMDAFETKEDVYGDLGLTANGLRMVQMHGLSEFYKTPLQYLFAMLSPFTRNYFSSIFSFSWLNLMTTANITLYPIAFGSFVYVFCKKHNFLFWITTAIVFIAITSMVLAIPRHYFFLFPIHVINYACFMDVANDNQKKLVKNLSLALVIIIFILTIKSI